MRLIDADKLHYHKVIINAMNWTHKEAVVVFAKEIDKAEIIDTVPVVHGNWIKYAVDIPEHPFHCSVCSWSNHHIDQRLVKEFNGCPNCGAKMDGDE